MPYDFMLRLHPDARVDVEQEDIVVRSRGGVAVRCHRPGCGIRFLLSSLETGGNTADCLIDDAVKAEPDLTLSSLYFVLFTLNSSGLLCFSVQQKGVCLVTLDPMSASFEITETNLPGQLRLARLASLRRIGGSLVAESVTGNARVTINESSILAMLFLIVRPVYTDEILSTFSCWNEDVVRAVLMLLVSADIAQACDDEGRSADEVDPLLRHWEYHDLLFHTRSRAGRHNFPMGGTYRFKGLLPQAGATKRPMSEAQVPLSRPTSARHEVEFFDILDKRRSRRGPGSVPIRIDQLSEFLWRTARVQKVFPENAAATNPDVITWRPSPSGGALHGLEIYLTVSRCEGLLSGLYRYDPALHVLDCLPDEPNRRQLLVIDAMAAAGMSDPPNILITVAARFCRIAWKYEGVAYALAQKDVGALFQQMYLVATALQLAPCALGVGNSETFAELIGVSRYEEPSIGEFMLSSIGPVDQQLEPVTSFGAEKS